MLLLVVLCGCIWNGYLLSHASVQQVTSAGTKMVMSNSFWSFFHPVVHFRECAKFSVALRFWASLFNLAWAGPMVVGSYDWFALGRFSLSGCYLLSGVCFRPSISQFLERIGRWIRSGMTVMLPGFSWLLRVRCSRGQIAVPWGVENLLEQLGLLLSLIWGISCIVRRAFHHVQPRSWSSVAGCSSSLKSRSAPCWSQLLYSVGSQLIGGMLRALEGHLGGLCMFLPRVSGCTCTGWTWCGDGCNIQMEILWCVEALLDTSGSPKKQFRVCARGDVCFQDAGPPRVWCRSSERG